VTKSSDKATMSRVGIGIVDLFDRKMADKARNAAMSLRELSRELALKGQGSVGSVGYSVHKSAVIRKARHAAADLHKLGAALPYSKYKIKALNESGALERMVDLNLAFPSAEGIRAQASEWDAAADEWEE
jgi:hypothetical protein